MCRWIIAVVRAPVRYGSSISHSENLTNIEFVREPRRNATRRTGRPRRTYMHTKCHIIRSDVTTYSNAALKQNGRENDVPFQTLEA